MVKEARVSFLAQPANLERYICAVSQESSKIPGLLLEIIAEAKPGYFDRGCVIIRNSLERAC